MNEVVVCRWINGILYTYCDSVAMVIDNLKSIFMKTNNFYRRYDIMLKCWQNNPDVRPTFSELKNQLKDMENQHKVTQVESTY